MYNLMKKGSNVIGFILALALIINIPINAYAQESQVNLEIVVSEEEGIGNASIQQENINVELLQDKLKELNTDEENELIYKEAGVTVFGLRLLGPLLNRIVEEAVYRIFTEAVSHLMGSWNIGGINSGEVKGPYTKAKFNGRLPENWVGDPHRNLRDRVLDLQSGLDKKGYNTGLIDGYWGTKTKTALRNFQASEKLAVDGSCGSATWLRICALF